MSYCRFGGDSDVYLVRSIANSPMGGKPRPLFQLWVAGHKDQDWPEEEQFNKFSTLIKRLKDVRAAGKTVPQRVFERLNRERAQAGRDIP